MILTCPECSVRYLLNAQVLMPGGRRVKCSACGHIWFQIPDEEGEGAFDGPDVMQEIPQSVRPIPDDFVPAPPPPEPQSSTMPRALGVAAATLLFLAGAGALVVKRTDVVAAWPPAAPLFELVGLEVEPPGKGLVFDRIKAVTSHDTQGRENLKIEGKIINLTRQEIAVPPIQATLRDAAGDDHEQWSADPPAETLAPESEAVFTLTYPGVPDHAASVNVRLLAARPAASEEKPAASSGHQADSAGTKAGH